MPPLCSNDGPSRDCGEKEGRSVPTDSITPKIIQALAEYLHRDPATIQEHQHLHDDLGLDSMAVIELLYKIEEVFDLQIPDQDLVGLTTVSSLSSYVQERMTPAKAPDPRATSSPN